MLYSQSDWSFDAESDSGSVSTVHSAESDCSDPSGPEARIMAEDFAESDSGSVSTVPWAALRSAESGRSDPFKRDVTGKWNSSVYWPVASDSAMASLLFVMLALCFDLSFSQNTSQNISWVDSQPRARREWYTVCDSHCTLSVEPQLNANLKNTTFLFKLTLTVRWRKKDNSSPAEPQYQHSKSSFRQYRSKCPRTQLVSS